MSSAAWLLKRDVLNTDYAEKDEKPISMKPAKTRMPVNFRLPFSVRDKWARLAAVGLRISEESFVGIVPAASDLSWRWGRGMILLHQNPATDRAVFKMTDSEFYLCALCDVAVLVNDFNNNSDCCSICSVYKGIQCDGATIDQFQTRMELADSYLKDSAMARICQRLVSCIGAGATTLQIESTEMDAIQIELGVHFESLNKNSDHCPGVNGSEGDGKSSAGNLSHLEAEAAQVPPSPAPSSITKPAATPAGLLSPVAFDATARANLIAERAKRKTQIAALEVDIELANCQLETVTGAIKSINDSMKGIIDAAVTGESPEQLESNILVLEQSCDENCNVIVTCLDLLRGCLERSKGLCSGHESSLVRFIEKAERRASDLNEAIPGHLRALKDMAATLAPERPHSSASTVIPNRGASAGPASLASGMANLSLSNTMGGGAADGGGNDGGRIVTTVVTEGPRQSTRTKKAVDRLDL